MEEMTIDSVIDWIKAEFVLPIVMGNMETEEDFAIVRADVDRLNVITSFLKKNFDEKLRETLGTNSSVEPFRKPRERKEKAPAIPNF